MGKHLWLAVVAAGLAGSAYAFDPLLFVKEIKGTASIVTPGTDAAQPLSGNRAYFYGSRIETAPGAEVRIAISERNVIVLGPDTTAIFMTGKDDGEKIRTIQVEKGSATALLEDDFDKKGTRRVILQTIGGMGEPVSGGEYSVTVTPEADMAVAEYSASRGEMKVYDNTLFLVPALRHDYRLSLGVAYDKSFVRLLDRKGRFLVDLQNLQNADGTPKTVEMHPDTTLKIWRKQSDLGGVWVVTVLFVNAKGGLVESLSYNVKPE